MQQSELHAGDGTVRVAAAQFATGTDGRRNVEACLRAVDAAAKAGAALVVLPEFANHLSWYDSAAHCFEVALTLDGPFLGAIATRARQHALYIVVNTTLRRAPGVVTATSLLFGPNGACLAESDKQVLMGHENEYLTRASRPGPVVETAVGRLGLYACMDGVVCETPRSLALRGAQVLCNSLNSFAPDEAELHIPVRAAENRVFVVAANKVGPLVPEALLDGLAEATRIPRKFLFGAGESQIVAPDGTVLARAPREGEALAVADIVPHLADSKRRVDGTDVFAVRRPGLYAPIALAPVPMDRGPEPPREIVGAVWQPTPDERVEDAARATAEAVARGVDVLVLPELFGVPDGRVFEGLAAMEQGRALVAALVQALAGSSCHVATSIVTEGPGGPVHMGVLVGPRGVVLEQPQMHETPRHGWASAVHGGSVAVVDLPIGRVALVVGDDALQPETMRLVALRGAEVALVPFHALESWETTLGLPERSAENHICLVASTRATAAGTSLLATVWEDFTLMTPWRTRPFDGRITAPVVTRAGAGPGLTVATLHPLATRNKLVSARTDLVADRAWALAGALVTEGAGT